MPRIDIRGVLIPNDYKWYYDILDIENTCPKDVSRVLNALQSGDVLEVYINSPGGVIDVGSEIYALLRKTGESYNVKLYVTGEACSAASVVAMAGYCEMAPTALMMVHCVSTSASGNHNDMEKMVEVLQQADRAMCTAYTEKTGMTEEEALDMMEHETWLTAQQAKDRGLVDAVMFEEQQEEGIPLVAGPLFKLPTKEQMEQVRKLAGLQEEDSGDTAVLLQKVQKRLDLMSKPKLNMVP